MNTSTSLIMEQRCQIQSFATTVAVEFKAFQYPLVGTVSAELPSEPGAVRRDTAGNATLLHYGPGVFLAPLPNEALLHRLQTLETAGLGAVFDVCGQWHQFRLTGALSTRLLSSGIDIEHCVPRRDCAAVHLFDSPALLLLQSTGFDVWVPASYATAFSATLVRLRERLINA
jgi:hypothetical protein